MHNINYMLTKVNSEGKKLSLLQGSVCCFTSLGRATSYVPDQSSEMTSQLRTSYHLHFLYVSVKVYHH
ncbi:hypothetical protein B566_EDAN008178 [Ephemera danica]|nr:hypothetical protein B566_EDAN008178 [Ephemera danica]